MLVLWGASERRERHGEIKRTIRLRGHCGEIIALGASLIYICICIERERETKSWGKSAEKKEKNKNKTRRCVYYRTGGWGASKA